jgi:hypothetical protein
MAYDAARHATVLYGGDQARKYPLTDTWTWTGTTWIQQHSTSEPALWDPGIAYDSARQRIVLFGLPSRHAVSGQPGETWTWNGQNWQREAPKKAPSARYFPLMTYDSKTQQVILFGGLGDRSQTFSDTWAWDGANWQELSTTIPGLSDGSREASMAYDSAVDRVVLYDVPGGFTTSKDMPRSMWLFDGSAWTLRSIGTTALPTDGHRMVYDVALQKLLLFGGEAALIPPQTVGRNLRSEIWLWDGLTWSSMVATTMPKPRMAMGMVYDTDRNQVLIFGGLTSVKGSDVSRDDTWTWDGAKWTRRGWRVDSRPSPGSEVTSS